MNPLRQLFKSGWTERLSRTDVEMFVEEPERIRVPSVTAKVVWLLSAQNRWSIKRLQQIVDKESTKRETWKVHGDIVCLVWQSGRARTSIPDGLLTVAFPYVFFNRAGRLSELHIEACLAWVRPQSRGKGIGRYLAHALFCYWCNCPLRYPTVARNGIEIEFIADVYSDAGQVVTSWLLEDLQYMGDVWKEERGRSPFWSSREVYNASDNYDAMRSGGYLRRM